MRRIAIGLSLALILAGCSNPYQEPPATKTVHEPFPCNRKCERELERACDVTGGFWRPETLECFFEPERP